jgi:DNA-binding NtrC family response regulator
LYFRLRALQIILPALRERGGDVLLLARHFRDVFAHRYGRSELPFDPHLEARLLAHTWPGNVRELRNIVEQAVLLCTDGAITSADMMLPESEGEGATGAPAKRPSALQRLEKETLLQALNDANRDEALAARLLGVSREAFRGRLSKHGLHA